MLSAFLKEIEREQARRRTENALAYYRPYAKQREFHVAGVSGPLARRRMAARPARAAARSRVYVRFAPIATATLQCGAKT